MTWWFAASLSCCLIIIFSLYVAHDHLQQYSDEPLPLPLFNSDSLINAVFCSIAPSSLFFPSHPNASAPWVWDASYNQRLNIVEITTIARQACKFDVITWQLLISLYPQYNNQLAYGNSKNILVDGWTNGSVAYRLMLAMELAVCYYYNDAGVLVASIKSTLVKRNLKWSSAGTFVVVCRAPPQCFHNSTNCSASVAASWSRMRLSIISPAGSKMYGNVLLSDEFPVCTLSYKYARKNITNNKQEYSGIDWLERPLRNVAKTKISANPAIVDYTTSAHTPNASTNRSTITTTVGVTETKLFSVIICSATSRSQKIELIEWLEYYILLGVQHFFIYDTCIDGITNLRNKEPINNRTSHRVSCYGLLSSKLTYYINSGVVTVVPWHYENCVRGMASGRGVSFRGKYEPLGNSSSVEEGKFAKNHLFAPPKAIAQSAALSSCYSRFKHLSKYVIHVDDDEFLTFSPNILNHYDSSSSSHNDTTESGSDASRGSHGSPTTLLLGDLADQIFDLFPRAPALSFLPVFMQPYNKSVDPPQESASSNMNSFGARTSLLHMFTSRKSTWTFSLPRLGNWTVARIGRAFEKKMLIRTDAVSMFYIHYISAWEPGDWEPKNSLILPIEMASLLHFKISSLSSGSIYGSVLPMDGNELQTMSPIIKNYSQISENFLIRLDKRIRNRCRNRYQLCG